MFLYFSFVYTYNYYLIAFYFIRIKDTSTPLSITRLVCCVKDGSIVGAPPNQVGRATADSLTA